MAFIKKTWLARIGVGLNRFRMNNSTDVVLESNPVSVTQQGDQLSADNMNNLETRIDNAFTEMAGNLATIEVSPSQHNWTVGSQIVYNGILYKVTSAISTDDNLVVGTNISPYPVSNAISDISDTISDINNSVPKVQSIPLNAGVLTGSFQVEEYGFYLFAVVALSSPSATRSCLYYLATRGQYSISGIGTEIARESISATFSRDGTTCEFTLDYNAYGAKVYIVKL